MKGKQIIRRLRKLGVDIIPNRGKGGHHLASYKGKRSVIPVHGDRDLSPNFIKMICKQLGIDPNEII